MKSLLLVDVSNTVIRNLSVNKYLEHEGEWTGGFYGTIGELVNIIIRNVQPTGTVFCCDSKPYLRDADYPNYKGDRKKKEYDEEDAPEGWDFYNALADGYRQLKEFCEIGNYAHWSIPGYEADDLVALCVNYYCETYDKIYILSNDSDLNQCLVHDNVAIWKKIGKGKKLYDKETFKAQFDIEPEEWAFYTAMVGTHNGVPGIRGIGHKTAPKIIHSTQKVEEVINKHREALIQKLDLIELPYFKIDAEKVQYPDPEIGKHNFRKIMVYLEQKGIDVTTRYREAFE